MSGKSRRNIIILVAVIVIAAAAAGGIWLYMNRFDPEAYVKAVLDVSYKKQTEGYMEITGASAEEAEQMQDYGMAEIFYRRAAGVKPGSTLWEEFQARREAAQDSINEIKE